MYRGLYYSALDCLQPPPLACIYYHNEEERYSACSHNKLATVNMSSPQGNWVTWLQCFVRILKKHLHKNDGFFKYTKSLELSFPSQWSKQKNMFATIQVRHNTKPVVLSLGLHLFHLHITLHCASQRNKFLQNYTSAVIDEGVGQYKQH